MNSSDDVKEYMKKVAHHAFPVALPVEAVKGRFCRRWIVRSGAVLPATDLMHEFASWVTLQVRQLVIDNYAEYATEQELQMSFPSVAFVRVDDYHLVVETELAEHGFSVGDSALLGTWPVLRFVDEKWIIEELEGIPKRFWWALQ